MVDQVVISILHVVAILSTLFRICHRAYKRQLWYDDYIAIIPLAFDCVYFTIFWRALTSKGEHNPSFWMYNRDDNHSQSILFLDYLRYRNNNHFFTSFMFGVIINMIVLWLVRERSFDADIILIIHRFSRISLALSLARIFPRGHVARRLSLCISGLCFLFFSITIALTIGLCQGGGRPWYRIDPHYCKKGPKRIPVNGIVAVLGESPDSIF